VPIWGKSQIWKKSRCKVRRRNSEEKSSFGAAPCQIFTHMIWKETLKLQSSECSHDVRCLDMSKSQSRYRHRIGSHSLARYWVVSGLAFVSRICVVIILQSQVLTRPVFANYFGLLDLTCTLAQEKIGENAEIRLTYKTGSGDLFALYSVTCLTTCHFTACFTSLWTSISVSTLILHVTSSRFCWFLLIIINVYHFKYTFSHAHTEAHTEAHIHDQHTRGMATTRHMGVGRKVFKFVRDKGLAHLFNKENSAHRYLKSKKKSSQ